MRSIAVEVIDSWVSPSHECALGACAQMQIETASNKHTKIETFDFELIF